MAQLVDICSLYGRDENSIAVGFTLPFFFQIIQYLLLYFGLQPFVESVFLVHVHLVEDGDGWLVEGFDVLEGAVYNPELVLELLMRNIYNMQKYIRLPHFIQSALKALNQVMRKFADETDGIGEENVLVGGQAQAPRRWIERGEQYIFGQRRRTGERVEQSRFACVGVTDNRGERPLAALAPGALRRSLAAHGFEFALDARDAVLHAAAVRFQLRFTFTAAHSNPAFLARQVAPESCQPREQMLQLREFDLQFAFLRPRALGEDVEDQGGAIEDFALETFFQVAALGGG